MPWARHKQNQHVVFNLRGFQPKCEAGDGREHGQAQKERKYRNDNYCQES